MKLRNRSRNTSFFASDFTAFAIILSTVFLPFSASSGGVENEIEEEERNQRKREKRKRERLREIA